MPDDARNPDVYGGSRPVVDVTLLDDVEAELRARPPVTRIIQLWSVHDVAVWRSRPGLYAQVVRRLIAAGEPFMAREVLAEARMIAPDDATLQYLEGLALARGGATMQALRVAEALSACTRKDAPIYDDVHGLAGRVAKDLAFEEPDQAARRAWLVRAYEAYHQAFAVGRASYTGINAATVALLLGDTDRAVALADDVQTIARTELSQQGEASDERFWKLATLGECALVRGDIIAAKEQYAAAALQGGVEWGDVSSTRRQARLICTHRGLPTGWIHAVMPVPAVVAFAGNRIGEQHLGHKGATCFPPGAEPLVRAAIRERLDALDAGFGFAGAADGGEILFHEVMHERGGKSYVVLPYGRDEFAATSVSNAGLGASDWQRRFTAVLDAAQECTITTAQRSVDHRLLFEYAHSMLLGLAALHARTIDAPLISLALWDGRDSAPDDATGLAVATWRAAGHMVEVLDIGAIVAGSPQVAAQ